MKLLSTILCAAALAGGFTAAAEDAAPTVTLTYATAGEKYLEIYNVRGGGPYTVDWGDGVVSEPYTSAQGFDVEIKSTTVKIYGDVRMVRTLYNDPQDITAVDLADNPNCTGLYFPSCQLSAIDVSGCPNILVLELSDNNIAGKLDLSNLASISSISVDGNKLTDLVLPENTSSWISLNCTGNQLESLNIKGAAGLVELTCGENLFTSLDLSGCPALEELDCHGNQLVSVDVAGCEALTKLTAYENQLVSVDVSANKNISSLYLQDNKISDINTEGCAKLSWVNLENNELAEFDGAGLANLRNLNVVNNHLASLDLLASPYCGQLFVDNNELTTLDTSAQGTSLSTFSCSGNRISSLDLSKNTYLYWFLASDNELSEIDLSGKAYLQRVELSNNKLTELDVTANSGLAEVLVDGNLMEAAALDAIVNALPDVTSNTTSGDWARRLDISNNPGTAEAVTAPAVDKGWTLAATSGINDAIGATGAYAVGGAGRIEIVGDASSVAVYSIAGQSLGSTLDVAPGLYVVTVDGRTFKVAVR